MFIQTETTPNPQTLKFLPGQAVMTQGTASYTDATAATDSPLAQHLLGIEGISGVFFGADFITITKRDAAAWDVLKPLLLTSIMDHLTAGIPVVKQRAPKADAAEDDALVAQIKELLETRVRPAVAQDGGDIVFHSFEDGIVRLEMHGACSGCPSSTATLKQGIESMLRHYVPEVIAVEPV